MMRATPLVLFTLPLFACTYDLGRFTVNDDDRGGPSLTPRARELPPSVMAERPPTPVSGGTLWAGETLVVAAESDRDQIHILSRTDSRRDPLRLVTRISLFPGEEPGRLVEGIGRFFVVLRGAGTIGVIEPGGPEHAAAWRMTQRIPVCAAPRGLDYADGELWAACLDGTLVRLDAATGVEKDRIQLSDDLRDVVITDESMFVSRFKTADVLILDREGGLRRTITLREHQPDVSFDDRDRIANTAYRMVKSEGDGVFISHQLSSEDTGVITKGPTAGGYGGARCTGALVVAGLSEVTSSGAVTMSDQGALVLPLDLAYSRTPRAQLLGLAIAAFGARARPTGAEPSADVGGTSVANLPSSRFQFSLSACQPFVTTAGTERTLSVAFADDGELFRQTTHPHGVWTSTGQGLVLEGADNFDAGHDLFFGDTGPGLACASCHPEGGEDGLTWIFEDIGPRRTQDLRGGIMDTVPFHWQGDIRGLDHLVVEVMGRRMGGPALTSDYLTALSRYIDGLRHPATPTPNDHAALQRGQAIFESAEAACSSCHAGESFGGPGSYDVGRGFAAQVPSLRGLTLRAPYMHDGCALTLEDRFEPECGGSEHGRTEHLTATQLGDLVTYLESL